MGSTIDNPPKGLSLTDLMIFRVRWWQHLIFWGIVLVILLNIFKTSGSYEKIDLIYTFIFVVPLIAIVYLNLYHFIPRYLRREQYLLFICFFILLMGAGALFLYFLFDGWIDLILPNYYFISYYSVPQLILYTGSILLLTTLLKLSRSWFMLLRMERMTTSHQLKALQSQINPHFLLNSLQTIYALSLEKSERTPRVILQLSEILKYTLYETVHSRVKLEKEIGMIKDYVEMYRHRVDPIHTDIQLKLEGDSGDKEIAPMLLIPFIENSFKHGLQGGTGGAFVHINIKICSGELDFRIENSMGSSDPVELDKRKGIGIDNTKQRLKLLYPGKHQLSISKEEGTFDVKLQIKLKD
ncbi:MAG: histidine kinase [Bacteroidota bacterium]